MRLPPFPAAIIVAIFSVSVLGAVWLVVLRNLSPRDVSSDDRSLSVSTGNSQGESPTQSQPHATPAEMPELDPQPSSSTSAVSSPPSRASLPERSQGTKDVQAACQAELETLCRDVSPQGGMRRRCIEEQSRRLDPACQQMLRERLTQLKTFASNVKAACAEDARRLCRRVGRRQGAMLQCLEEHSEELSGGCAQMLAQGNLWREPER